MSMAIGSRNETRMILLGITGGGKSSFGNTIIGKNVIGKDVFKASKSPNGVTKECTCATRDFNGKRLFLVDTPGFMDPDIEREEWIQKEVAKAYQVTALPGPHVFLLVLEPRRFTKEEAAAIEYLTTIFGAQAVNHTIVIFTHGDSFKPSEGTIKDYIKELSEESALSRLLEQCKQRYLLVNNIGTDDEKRKTIETLLDMITTMIQDNHGQVYRTSLFDAAAEVMAADKSKGINQDGSIILHPKIKEIIVEGFLRRAVARKVVH